jgi:hypothetical protein
MSTLPICYIIRKEILSVYIFSERNEQVQFKNWIQVSRYLIKLSSGLFGFPGVSHCLSFGHGYAYVVTTLTSILVSGFEQNTI